MEDPELTEKNLKMNIQEKDGGVWVNVSFKYRKEKSSGSKGEIFKKVLIIARHRNVGSKPTPIFIKVEGV